MVQLASAGRVAGSLSLIVTTSTSTAVASALLARSFLSSASESRSRTVCSMAATVLTQALSWDGGRGTDAREWSCDDIFPLVAF